MTCARCGMTIGWDCECDPAYSELVRESYEQELERQARARESELDAEEDNEHYRKLYGYDHL